MPVGAGFLRDGETEAGETVQVTLTACCFFFQAEDGIRDLTVTGVQTCALPISARRRRAGARRRRLRSFPGATGRLRRRAGRGPRPGGPPGPAPPRRRRPGAARPDRKSVV